MKEEKVRKRRLVLKVGATCIILVAIFAFMNYWYLRRKKSASEIPVDRPPTLEVKIRPEEPTDFRQVEFIITATDDSDLIEKSVSFPTLNICMGVNLSRIEGAPPRKKLRQIDSLCRILSKDDLAKLGGTDSLVVEISVTDYPHRQTTWVSKVIKLKKIRK